MCTIVGKFLEVEFIPLYGNLMLPLDLKHSVFSKTRDTSTVKPRAVTDHLLSDDFS